MNIQPFDTIAPIDDWNIFKKEGDQFLKTAVGAVEKRKKTFNAEAVYNLTAMAIEKFIMAFLMRQGDLADNHTMLDLLFCMERYLGKQPEVVEKLKYMDSFQEICDMENYSVKTPTEQDLDTIIKIGQEIQQLLAPYTLQPDINH